MTPWNEEAEVAVISAVLIDGDTFTRAAETLDESSFHAPRHRAIWRAYGRLFEKGAPIEPVTLQGELDRVGELKAAGGLPYIGEMLQAMPTSANIAYHANIVREFAQRRNLINAATEIVRDVTEPGDQTADALMDKAQQRIFAASSSSEAPMHKLKAALMPAFADMEIRSRSNGGITGITTGLAEVDAMTGGLQRGNLIVVAARPSMGKSAFMTGLTLGAALEAKVGVALFSLEMNRNECVYRMLCYEALVDLSNILRGTLSDVEMARIANAAGPLSDADVWIQTKEGLTPLQVRAMTRRLHKESPVGMVVVDYIGLMNGSGDNLVQQVGNICKGLKELAKELDIPVVALAQLSRANTQRENKRPQLSDLRDSGNIEEHADVVMLLHRPEYYMTPSDAQKEGKVGAAECIIAKQRNGPTGIVDLHFRKECARFESFKNGGQKW